MSSSAAVIGAAALAAAKPAVFWTDRPDAPQPRPAVGGSTRVDLAIVGGGFTGLWAAVQALEEDPGLSVLVLEGEVCGFGASSRNGGFCDASITHGLHNGLSHWPDEIETLLRLGHENLDAIDATVGRHDLDVGFHRTGVLSVALEPWQYDDLVAEVAEHQRHGEAAELLDRDAIQDYLHSPKYLGGMRRPADQAILDPGRLCWELARLAEKLGATIHDRSPVESIEADRSGLSLTAPGGRVMADRVIVATNAFRGPIRSPRRYVIPVYDHVLMTEPLSDEQLDSIGWSRREGVDEGSNQFHYFRLTDDNCMLWGGLDATYHFNNGLEPRHDQREETHLGLARDFFATFPQLEGLTFTHRWGGPIGTTTKFTATFGTGHQGRLAWVAGYTGLGVGASRFGARVALDLAFGRSTERTALKMVRRKPFPFPPEPFRWPSVQLTVRAIQRADRNDGRRGAWLRLLDRFGIGFNS